MVDLKHLFVDVATNYANNDMVIEKLWNEIVAQYCQPSRHYHTLHHLKSMVYQLSEVQSNISDWETVLLAVFYHDLVYDPSSSENEGQSAKVAQQRLREIGFPIDRVANCESMILATKAHAPTSHLDTDYLLDSDLAILGSPWDAYAAYTQQIRREYALFPDPIYTAGRKKVLLHFLQMEQIFKTPYFHGKLEVQAKANLQHELDIINN